MHEVSIAKTILEICGPFKDQILSQEGLESLGCQFVITVQIGCLAGVSSESLLFCFDSVSKETAFEGVELKIEQIKGQGRCNKCKTDQEASFYFSECKSCGDSPLEIYRGKELKVLSLGRKEF